MKWQQQFAHLPTITADKAANRETTRKKSTWAFARLSLKLIFCNVSITKRNNNLVISNLTTQESK